MKLCELEGCDETFEPSSHRQKYCCPAHRRRRAYENQSPEVRAKGQGYVRKRQAEARAWVDGLKKGKPCVDCGGVFPTCVMDYHHRDPATKEFGISQRVSYSRDRILAEIAKCDLICANCHRIRHHEEEHEA